MIEGHGDDLYKYSRPITANFSSNLTNWIDPTPLKAYLQQHIGEVVTSYPEPQPYTLEARVAETSDIRPDQVCVTNGATEAIYLIAQSYAGQRSAVLQPTFSEYADACRIHGHRVTSLFHLPENDRLPEELQTCWLCNPNNPTGLVIDKSRLIRLAENHSLTKRYAMPGLRLGYLTGHSSILHHLRTHRMPWSVNGVALLAGKFLLDHPEAVPFDLAGCLKETARLQALLRQTGCMDVWDTDTHFSLVHLRMGKAAALKDYLAQEHGLLIRDASNFEGLDATYFRLSTQQAADNERLVKAIRQWFEIE